jgi:hypothetical protein
MTNPLLLLSNNLLSSSNYGPFSFDYVVYISYKVICNFSLSLLILLFFSGCDKRKVMEVHDAWQCE